MCATDDIVTGLRQSRPILNHVAEKGQGWFSKQLPEGRMNDA